MRYLPGLPVKAKKKRQRQGRGFSLLSKRYLRRRALTRRILWLSVAGIIFVPTVHFARQMAYQKAWRSCAGHLQLLQVEELPDPILIVSPHPDDETGGCGGLIHTLVQRGRPPFVVCVTDGDAFDWAMWLRLDGVWLDPSRRSRFASQRLAELQRAMETLGLPTDHLSFLGFHEREIVRRWLLEGDRTLFNSMISLLRHLRPRTILVPARFDDHPVHSTVAALTWSALFSRSSSSDAPLPIVFEYLIHYGNFPVPQGLQKNLWLLPPKGVLDAGQWQAVFLSPSDQDSKQRALLRYDSQLLLSGRLLQSFVRRNELFLKPVLSGYLKDRVGEPRSFLPSSDIVSIAVEPLSFKRWHVSVRLRGRVSQSVQYGLHIFTLTTGPVLQDLTSSPARHNEVEAVLTATPPMVLTVFTKRGKHFHDIVPFVVADANRWTERREAFGQ
ncbi:MAG: PIG-L family deacetylase [Armatimonadetes bacterium]|nr:PIG-L family deacetylase [Armatimonadota bacterium]MDW8122251.1 PIG-L family deacetylase [Armatimonadota bacterium]